MATPTKYQAVVTATNYALTAEDGTPFKMYLRFDGTDDFNQTNSINFTATDKMTVFAGVRKLSDANYSVVVDLSNSPNVTDGSFSVGNGSVTGDPGRRTWGSFIRRGVLSGGVAYPYASPITNVVVASMDYSGVIAANQNVIRVNASQPTMGYEPGVALAGNFGAFPLFIGRRNGTTFPFNGRLYGLIVVGRALTANEIASTENWLNQRTGAY